MSQQNIYPDGYDDTVIETATNYTPMPRNLSWMAKHTANMMVDQAVLDAGQDKLAAQLARGSMQNIGSLGMMAEQLANINPDVGGCCRAIMATYLKGSLKRLERW